MLLSIVAWSCLHLRLELRDQRLLRVGLLLRPEIALRQFGVAVEVDPGVGELRLVLRLLGDGQVVLRLVGGRDRCVRARRPAFTSWPSLKLTSISLPSTCGRTVTVFSACTVPIASSVTGTSAVRTSAAVITTG